MARKTRDTEKPQKEVPDVPFKLRPQTYHDLTDEQKAFHDQLPEELREKFLAAMPLKRVSDDAAMRAKKIDSLQKHADKVQKIIGELTTYLNDKVRPAISKLEGGCNPSEIDLRNVKASPKVTGAILRFQRSEKDDEEESSAQ